MAKRTDFTKTQKEKKETKTAVDLLRNVATSNTRDTKGIEDTTDTKDEFRFSARFTPTQWKFLQEKKWTTRKSITAILQDYVEEDIKKNPEILGQIDELNG